MTAPEKLALTDVIEADDRIAHGGEVVASHVRFVLGFNRPATDGEVTVMEELLGGVEIVQSVSADGIEVITPDRETPGRPIGAIRTAVDRVTDEAEQRAAVEEKRRSTALEDSLRQELVGEPDPHP